MEWVLGGPDREAVAVLRREVLVYLRRHGDPRSDFAGAEIVVAELLANAFEHAPGTAWVRLTWGDEHPRIEVHDLGPGFDLGTARDRGGRGLLLADALALDLAGEAKRAGGSKVTATLPVDRARGIAPAAPAPGARSAPRP